MNVFELNHEQMQEVGSRGLGRLTMFSSISKAKQLDFRDTLIFVAETFGFKHDQNDERSVPKCWTEFSVWQDAQQIQMGHIKGPHAFALLKLLAAQRNVSVQASDD